MDCLKTLSIILDPLSGPSWILNINLIKKKFIFYKIWLVVYTFNCNIKNNLILIKKKRKVDKVLKFFLCN